MFINGEWRDDPADVDTNVRIDGVVHDVHDFQTCRTRCLLPIDVLGTTEAEVYMMWCTMVTRDFITCLACLGEYPNVG